MSSITYDDLRTSLKRCDAGYAVVMNDNMSHSQIVMRSRVREVFHLAVLMCDARMGTVEEIKNIVNDRMLSIRRETSAFIPNIFEMDEEDKNPDTSVMENYTANATPMNRTGNSTMEDEDNWETDSEASSTHQEADSDEESEEEIDHNASPHPDSNTGLTFRFVRRELKEALLNYEQDYIEEADTVDYYEAQQAFHEGIEQTKKPEKGQTPEKIWEEVEEKLIQSAYMARRRQYADEDGGVRLTQVQAQLQASDTQESSMSPHIPIEELNIDEGTDEEDEDVRRMMAEVAQEDGEKGDEDVVVPETPTQSPTSARAFSHGKRKLPFIYDSSNEYALISVGKRSPKTPPASPMNKSVRLDSNQQHPYNFSPVLHAGQPMSAAPAIMQNFYRATVQHTLEEMLNNNSSEEVKDWIDAYWRHIEKEVPAPQQQQQSETAQAIQRPGWLRTTFRNASQRDVSRSGWR